MRKHPSTHAVQGRRARPTGRGEVRVIAGQWRSRKLAFPGVPGLRPTPDRVRETLFNWLGHDLSGFRCLDLYAGSGALGFEALSRGAAAVVMVERNPQVVRALEQSAATLATSRLQIVCADALEFVRDAGKRTVNVPCFDVIFLDPPFGEGVSHAVLQWLPPLLASGGRVYVESATAADLPPQWRMAKRGRAGQVHFQLMQWGPA